MTSVQIRERKAPRRTAERILETSLALFNRHGEAQVSPNMIAAELSMSPGNLYYHFAAKDDLVLALHDQWMQRLDEEADQAYAADDSASAREGWRRLMTLAWDYRFLSRNLNDLLARNRALEASAPVALATLDRVLGHLLDASGLGADRLEASHYDVLRTSLSLTITSWFNRELVLDPRHGTEEEQGQILIGRGLRHVEALLTMAQLRSSVV